MLLVFDDERRTNKAGRRFAKDPWKKDYDEYCDLMGDFMRLNNYTIHRNHYVELANGTKVIPRIQNELLKAEGNVEKEQELKAFEAKHIALWESIEDVIDEICKNLYVWSRLPGTIEDHTTKELIPRPQEVEDVKASMYALIPK